jgi:nucleoside-diphosphate-sugar epimerase
LIHYQGLQDLVNLIEAIPSVDVVLHTACSYGRKGETLSELLEANVHFGLCILRTLEKRQNPCVFINSGTGLKPNVSGYALTKRFFSDAAMLQLQQSNSSQIKYIETHLEHMYGPGDDGSKFITFLYQSFASHLPELKLTKGEQIRDFIYIADVLSAFDVLIKNRFQLKSGQKIDIGSGRGYSLRSVVEQVCELMGAKTTLNFGAIPYRQNEQMYSVADTSFLQSLGWVAQFDLTDGLIEMMKQENRI